MKARSYLLNCQTNLVIALDALSLLFCKFINTTAYHLGRYKPSYPVSCPAPSHTLTTYSLSLHSLQHHIISVLYKGYQIKDESLAINFEGKVPLLELTSVQSYKASTIVNYGSRVIIYERKMFIRLATACTVL